MQSQDFDSKEVELMIVEVFAPLQTLHSTNFQTLELRLNTYLNTDMKWSARLLILT